MIIIIFIAGILLQVVASAIALVQVRYAPRKLPWLLIALSAMLMVVHRSATLGHLRSSGGELGFEEIIALLLSLFFFLGVILMSRMFSEVAKGKKALQESEETIRESEKRLVESKQVLSGVLKHTHMMTVYLDPCFNFVWVNRAYADTCKHTPLFFPGKNHFDLYPNAENQAIFQHAVDSGQPFFITAKPFVFPDQPERGVTYWDWSIIPVKDDIGKVSGLVFTLVEVTDRIRTQESLMESEERFHAFMDNSPAIAWAKDENGRLVYLNRAFEKRFGARLEDCRGKTDFELWPQEIAEQFWANDQVVLSTGITIEIEEETKNPDGGCCTWLNLKFPFQDVHGNKYVGGIGLDITERKQLLDTLQKNSSLLRMAGRTARFGGWSVTLPDQRVIWSDEVALIHEKEPGYSPTVEEAINFYAPEWREKIAKAFGDCASKGTPYDEEIEIITARGHRRWVRTLGEAMRDSSGTIVQVHGSFQDISERKQAEADLRGALNSLKFHLENTPLAVIEFNCAYQITAWSKKAEAVFGWTAEEVMGKRIDELRWIYEEDADGVAKLSADMLDHKRLSNRHKNRNYRKDGSVIVCEWYNSVLPGETEDQFSVLSLVLDITDRVRAEEQKEKLETQTRQLQKSESLGRMAGALAHHFNNQLQVVLSNLELVQNELPPAPIEVLEMLANAMQAAQRASEISGLMLTYVGQTQGKRTPLSLSELCRQNLPMLQVILPKNVELNAELSEPGPLINTNANHIQQILTNLLTNAGEAARGAPSVVQLSVKKVLPDAVAEAYRFPVDSVLQHNAYACLEVVDNGCGIAAKNMEKVFDPFFSSKLIGRGMGLPVVLGIVKAHDGVITVESELGHGSVFRIYFPMIQKKISQPTEQISQTPEFLGGGTVLLADDEEPVRDVAELMLDRLGFTVLAAKDGAEAVELFRQHQNEICCVVCDLTMPLMDGWETLNALRQLSPGIPVILASGFDQAQVLEGNHPELPQAFLKKPFRTKDLHNALWNVLGNKKEG